MVNGEEGLPIDLLSISPKAVEGRCKQAYYNLRRGEISKKLGLKLHVNLDVASKLLKGDSKELNNWEN